MNELKPCPRCGGEATTSKLDSIGRWFVGCVSGHCVEIADSFETEQEAIEAWNQRYERTCHMTLKKSGSLYDVWHFDCCDKEWAESRCTEGVVDYPGVVCPYCGAKVVE